MQIIIPDTNILMAIGQFKIDIFSEIERAADFNYEIKVLDKTLGELEKIKEKGKGKDKAAAKLALAIIKKKKIKKIKTKEGTVDDILVELAGEGALVATQDKELKKRIKEAGGQVMTIRQGKRLVWG